MARRQRESAERKRYLTVVKREKPSDGKIVFSFDPALSIEQMEVVSKSTNDFIDANLKPQGGGFIGDENGGNEKFTGIAVPQSLDREVVLALFRLLERDGICDKFFPAEERRDVRPAPDVTRRQSETRQRVEAATAPEDLENQKFSVIVEIQKSEKVDKDVRVTLDVMTKVKGEMRAHEKSEVIIFEYNGAPKKIQTSKKGTAQNAKLYFRDAADSKGKLRCWPEKNPDEVTEYQLTFSDDAEPKSDAEQVEELAEKLKKAVETMKKDADEKAEKERLALVEKHKKELEEAAEREAQLKKEHAEQLAAAKEREGGLKEILSGHVLIPKPKTHQELEKAKASLQESMNDRDEPDLNMLRLVLGQKEPIIIRENQVLVLPEKAELQVMCDIIVEKEGVIFIKAGTKLLFDEEGGVICRGLMKAVGKENEKIEFKGLDKDKGWKNITLEGNDENLLQHCDIQDGRGRHYRISGQKQEMEEGTAERKLTNGGGLACINGCEKTVLKSVKIHGCKVSGHGGGIWNYKASPEMLGVDSNNNEARKGGGIYIDGSPSIETSRFEYNKAIDGGGIYMTTNENSMPLLKDSSIEHNVAKHKGGGVFFDLHYHHLTSEAYHPTVEEVAIVDNHAQEGGGCYVYNNISKFSYDFMKHSFTPNLRESGNTPTFVKIVFERLR